MCVKRIDADWIIYMYNIRMHANICIYLGIEFTWGNHHNISYTWWCSPFRFEVQHSVRVLLYPLYNMLVCVCRADNDNDPQSVIDCRNEELEWIKHWIS